ncbi:MAG: accessory gene regulator B family protein [Peptostreptococcaceae bacterium]|nr:accessory gene regulator B family protein [Peptostreptococcaceae bacterium]
MEKIKWTKKLSSRIMKKIADILDKDYNSDEIQIAEYSVESILMNIYKIPIIFIGAYLLGLFKEVTVMFFAMSFIRATAWGVHLKTGLGCLILTVIDMYLVTSISRNINMNLVIGIFLLIIAFGNYYKYAPADTEDRPCLDENVRIQMKKKTIVRFFLLVSIAILSKLYYSIIIYNIIILTLFVMSWMIHPLTYKIFDRGYRNYEKYS